MMTCTLLFCPTASDTGIGIPDEPLSLLMQINDSASYDNECVLSEECVKPPDRQAVHHDVISHPRQQH